MEENQRPSVLAVGMPELFDVAGGVDSTTASRFSQLASPFDAADAGVDAVSGELSAAGAGRITRDVFSADTGLLRWMIYSTKAARSASQSSADGEELAGDETSTATLDDSAYGLSLDAVVTVADRMPIGLNDSVSFIHAASGKRAIELLRALRFDLLVTSDRLPDMTVNQLIGRVRAVRPWQKWALVGSEITPQSEIAARSMGAAAVFDAPGELDTLSELAGAVASHEPMRTAVGAAEPVSASARSGRVTRTNRRG